MNSFYVHKISQTFDEGKQSWFDTYEAPGVEGTPVNVQVPREEQAPEIIRRYLLRAGADIPNGSRCIEMIAEAVAQEAPVTHRVAHVGWQDGLSAFVTHYDVFASSEETSLAPPEPRSMSIAPPPPKGILAAWLEIIKSAVFSTTMIVVLAAMFGAALIRPLRRQSFGLVLVGWSRCGKSTAQLVGGSVVGLDTEESMPSLNATPSGLLSVAVAYSDHGMVINEVGSAKGRRRDVYEVIRETTYALLNGHDTIRHPLWGGLGGTTTRTFRTLLILSSEHSPDEWAARNGEFRDEGETARLISMPVIAEGRKTVFDLAPKHLKGEALVAWEGERFKHLIEGVANNHGLAFPHFMRDFVANQAARLERAEYYMQLFQHRLRHKAHSRVALDIVAKFSIILAGGMLAVDAGALPFSHNQVGGAVWRACRAALKALPNPERDLIADLNWLKECLGSGSVIDQGSGSRQERRLMGQADGFRQPKRGGIEYVVRAEVFCDWFRDNACVHRVLMWLDANGHLQHAGRAKPGCSNAWAQKQVMWPNGTRPRSIVIYLPNGTADLKVA